MPRTVTITLKDQLIEAIESQYPDDEKLTFEDRVMIVLESFTADYENAKLMGSEPHEDIPF